MSSGLFWPLDSETSGEVDPSDEPRRTAFTSGSCPGGQLELHDCLLWGDLCCGVFWSILAPPPAPVIMTRNVSRHTHTHTIFAGSSGFASLLYSQNQCPAT